METVAHISSISVAVATMLGLLWAGWVQWSKRRNRRRDRLIALLRICAAPSQYWPSDLPKCLSVEFTPTHHLGMNETNRVSINHILVGDEVPAQGKWWKYRGEKPLAIIIFSNSPNSLAIVPNKEKEGQRIQTKSRAYPGYDFILGFDLSLLDSPDSHILASNHPFLLRNILSMCHWVTAGPHQKLMWVPCAIIYTTCENPRGDCVRFCSRFGLEGHGANIRAFQYDDEDKVRARYSNTERLFVSSPMIAPDHPLWAESYGRTEGPEQIRQMVYDGLAETIGTRCEKLATRDPERDCIFPLPIAPEAVFRELGWVLLRQLPSDEWAYVHQCRVRLTEDGYQGVRYSQPLWHHPTTDVASDKVIASFQNEWDTKATKFPFREEWADACKDIIRDTFPCTKLLLPEFSECHWLPAEQRDWGGAIK